MNNFKKVNLDKYRHVYVVGDIHGMFSLLEERLADLGFDYNQDALVSVGDLVDRGSESHRAIQIINKPWFYWVKGNHEDMTLQAGGTSWHVSNGGRWYNEIDSDIKGQMRQKFSDAPVILEIERNGKHYGIVHADYLTNDWADAEQLANDQPEGCMWSRDRIARAQHDIVYRNKFGQKEENNRHKPIKGIDHVFFGHTPIEEILTVDNCTWLDTGAVFGWMFSSKDTATSQSSKGKLSIVNLDDY